jgi:hypothetical protein
MNLAQDGQNIMKASGGGGSPYQAWLSDQMVSIKVIIISTKLQE